MLNQMLRQVQAIKWPGQAPQLKPSQPPITTPSGSDALTTSEHAIRAASPAFGALNRWFMQSRADLLGSP
jgi:hypothetical protein